MELEGIINKLDQCFLVKVHFLLAFSPQSNQAVVLLCTTNMQLAPYATLHASLATVTLSIQQMSNCYQVLPFNIYTFPTVDQ